MIELRNRTFKNRGENQKLGEIFSMIQKTIGVWNLKNIVHDSQVIVITLIPICKGGKSACNVVVKIVGNGNGNGRLPTCIIANTWNK